MRRLLPLAILLLLVLVGTAAADSRQGLRRPTDWSQTTPRGFTESPAELRPRGSATDDGAARCRFVGPRTDVVCR